MQVTLTELERTVSTAIKKLGYTGDDHDAIKDALIYAELRGNNQGIVKIATGGVPAVHEVEPFRLKVRNKCGALLSGGHSMATTQKAVKLAIEIASECGVGIVGSNHTFSSSGAIGFYARSIAKAKMIGIVCVGNGAFSFVAPTGSAEPRFGTNPIAYAIPYDEGEVVFDNATSAMAFFGLMEAKLKGDSIPSGIGYDKDGQPTTDPAGILDGGSLATFAGHKGYGLSLLVQVLGGAFCDAGAPGVDEKSGAGVFVMAIDPNLISEGRSFEARASSLLRRVRSARPLANEPVLLPGQKGDRRANAALETGVVNIADEIWEQLCAFVSND